MTSSRLSFDVPLISAFALILVIAPHLDAQWVKLPTPGAPRTADGKVDLRGPAPRTADGKPDLAGMWLAEAKFNRDLAADFKGVTSFCTKQQPSFCPNTQTHPTHRRTPIDFHERVH